MEIIVFHIEDEKCDVVVYGNNRGFSSDVFLVHAARMAGVPLVGELLNLYVHRDVVPDVLVGPSHYSVEHESIKVNDKSSDDHTLSFIYAANGTD